MQRGGAEYIIHRARALATEGAGVVTIDFRNAFNCLSRRAVARRLLDRPWATPLRNIFDLLYCAPSRLFWWGGELSSTEGVRQGCVLGPLLFCVGTFDLLRETAARFPDVTILAYLDDITLCSQNPIALQEALSFILLRAKAELDLEANPTKCFAHGAPARNIAGTVFAEAGLKILGAWVAAPNGPDDTQKHLERTRLKHVPLFETIPLMEAECAYAVLRACAVPVWTYQTRTHPDTFVQSGHFDKMIAATFCKIVGTPSEDFSPDHAALVALPVSLGGAGLRFTADLCRGNYEASSDPAGDDQETRTAVFEREIAERVDEGPLAPIRAAAAKRGAGAWLQGPSADYFFPPDAFAAALRYRLGLFENWGSKTSRRCNGCGLVLLSPAAFSHHILGCASRKGLGPAARHTELKNLFARACRENLLTHTVEPQLRAGDFADLSFFPPNESEDALQTVVDFTVTSSLARSGASEAAATKRKKDRYKDQNLVVAQVDVMGGMSNALVNLISRISSFANDDAGFHDRLRTHTAKAIQVFNGLILARASLKQPFGASEEEAGKQQDSGRELGDQLCDELAATALAGPEE
jgi:hypothetical protein